MNRFEEEVIKAAKNIVHVKGRHNTELAYKRLKDAVEKLQEYRFNEGK